MEIKPLTSLPSNIQAHLNKCQAGSKYPGMHLPMSVLLHSHDYLYCSQLYYLIIYFAHFISNLPSSVHEICIDFNACAIDGSLDHSGANPKDWMKLDGVFMNRHELGLLKCITFKCTTWANSGRGNSNLLGPITDWTILGCVQTLLPRSKQEDILHVNHSSILSEFWLIYFLWLATKWLHIILICLVHLHQYTICCMNKEGKKLV